ncbi:unnamed protein product [Ambrosiozyma monospora]|uniref:Unnamed protein product n=1 Tax=Ambrosiozyma monospora TaxID=43982 RepID=A0ACB5UCB8_AMBMO|nr:unnamed protein product [Ambrosiozyma monospora]
MTCQNWKMIWRQLMIQLRNQLIIKSATNTIYTDSDLNNYPVFKTWKRAYCIRPKQKVGQTARLAEKLQEQQKKEKEQLMVKLQKEKVKHLLDLIQDAHNEMIEKKSSRQALGRSIHHFHQQVERDEGKRMERTAKQRLAALKSNDEEAYLALLDQTKDTRITHLLKQTNSFLDSLANAVKVQQHETKVMTEIDNGEIPESSNSENTEEDREKIDYYEVAHTIKETVTKQPSILVGGKLKEYQMKGLEWMVSFF